MNLNFILRVLQNRNEKRLFMMTKFREMKYIYDKTKNKNLSLRPEIDAGDF